MFSFLWIYQTLYQTKLVISFKVVNVFSACKTSVYCLVRMYFFFMLFYELDISLLFKEQRRVEKRLAILFWNFKKVFSKQVLPLDISWQNGKLILTSIWVVWLVKVNTVNMTTIPISSVVYVCMYLFPHHKNYLTYK